jgi:molecular chaperone DnaK (HSP70)
VASDIINPGRPDLTMWALDIGSTKTALAHWDKAGRVPRLLAYSEIAKRRRWWKRRAESLPPLAAGPEPAAFKHALASAPFRTLTTSAGRSYRARELASAFMRDLLEGARRASGQSVDELLITTPAQNDGTYRTELLAIAHELGLKRLRFMREPVAATLGSGVLSEAHRRVLVVDFGTQSLRLSVVEQMPRSPEGGRVLAHVEVEVGGHDVDRWVLEHFAQRCGFPLLGAWTWDTSPTPTESEREEQAFWHDLLLPEAKRAKENASAGHRGVFALIPPDSWRVFEARLRQPAPAYELDRATLAQLLKQHGLYELIERTNEEIAHRLVTVGHHPAEIDQVMLVGGSCLLPGVLELFQERFGKTYVSADQVFEAIVCGACAHAAALAGVSDLAGKMPPAETSSRAISFMRLALLEPLFWLALAAIACLANM